MQNQLTKRLETYFDLLWPLPRSLTGPGYRKSLDILSQLVPFERLSFKSGCEIFDWTVPKEWTPNRAYFVDPLGRKHADFEQNSLHLLGYSVPVKKTMDYKALRPHLHSLPEMSHAIPYLTSYYKEEWGFCLSHEELMSLPREGDYEVLIDTNLRDGFVELGEAILPGESKEEVLFSTYLCHPSMANNELSGPLVMAFLYERISALPRRRFTYRFVIGPETIGALCYLNLRGEHLKKCLKAGYVITCIGDPGKFTYKKSRQEDSLADRVALSVLCHRANAQIIPFDVSGSDERQYCSPGFNLPVGSLMRTRWGRYPEYHTSLDNKTFISFEAMAESIEVYFSLVQTFEANYQYVRTNPFGEPQLGKRGLYPVLGSDRDTPDKMKAMMWLLNLADGTRDLVGIAERSQQPIDQLIPLAKKLEDAGLLKRVVP